MAIETGESFYKLNLEDDNLVGPKRISSVWVVAHNGSGPVTLESEGITIWGPITLATGDFTEIELPGVKKLMNLKAAALPTGIFLVAWEDKHIGV